MRGRYAEAGEPQQMFQKAIQEVKSGSIDPERAAQEIDLSLGGLDGGIEDFEPLPNQDSVEASLIWERNGEDHYREVGQLPDVGATHQLCGILADVDKLERDRDQYRAQKYLETLQEEEKKAFDALLGNDLSDAVQTYMIDTGRSMVINGNGSNVVEQLPDEEAKYDIYSEVGRISFIYNELFDEIGRDAREKFRSRYGQHQTPRFEEDTVALEAKQLNQATNAGTKDFRYIFRDTDDGKEYRGIACHTGQNDQYYKWA